MFSAAMRGSLVCAALSLVLISGVASPAAGNEGPSVRGARAAGGGAVVQPVDCVMSEWSAWSRCDTCQKKRYRYVKVEQPSQYGGEPCHVHDREEEDCAVPSRYTCGSVPLCEGFLCSHTGRCVHRTLRCNGEDDCGDMSDEEGCKKASKPCREQTEEYWGIENLAKGVNVLSGDMEGVVLDNRYYAGSCLPHYVQDTRFRKPYNVQQFTYQTKGSYDFTLQAFSTYSDYMEYSFKEYSSQTSFSIGFGLPGVFEFGLGYSDSSYRKNVRKTRSVSDKAHSFVRAKAQLELAQYMLKPEELMLHTEFLRRLRSLPQAYVYGEYRQIFRDYGTHYITEAALGGDYVHTIILDKEKLENSEYTLDQYKNCVQVGLNVGVNIQGVYVTGGLEGGGCDGLLNEMGEDTAKGNMVEDFVASVRGGSSESITALVSKRLPTPQLMRLWGEGVRFNPAFISKTTRPIYELVTSRDFSSDAVLKRNLKKALSEYLAEASSCRCAPCRHNGVAVLKGSRCECICPNGYSGRACEITQRPKEIAVDGSWSCWGAWSSCSGGTMTRSRRCNNPPPSTDGMDCRGLQQEATDCVSALQP